MKYPKLILFVVMLTAALIVSACGGASTTTKNDPPAATSQPDTTEKDSQSAVNVIETNVESSETETGDEHSDGDEHAAEALPAGDAEHSDGDEHAATEAPATDAEHSDGDEHAAAATEGEHNDTEHEHETLPDEYASKTNPFASGDANALAAGEQVYTATCASCHGAEGKGDGPAAAALDPHPADFTNAEIMNGMSDNYLFWRISEGGMMAPFNSSMPAWKQALTEEQRWQAILYLRTFTQ